MSMFKKASRKNVLFRGAFAGVPGAGKTFTALRVMHALMLARGIPLRYANGRAAIAFLDSDRLDNAEDAHIYAGEVNPDGGFFDFDVVHITDNAPSNYTKILKAAAAEGYRGALIDTLSKAWSGEGGALEKVDNYARRNKGNSFGAWRDVTPEHNELVTTMLTCPMDLIATLRSKMEHSQEKDPKTGRTVIKKLGLAAVQREGMEYEFDLVGDLDDGLLTVSKTRFSALRNGVFREAGSNFAEKVMERLASGEAVEVRPTPKPVEEASDDGDDPSQAFGNDDPPADGPPASSDDHDPSFTTDERKKFMAYVGDLGFKYEEACQLGAAHGKKRPSQMTKPERVQFAIWLCGQAWERDREEMEKALKGIDMTLETANGVLTTLDEKAKPLEKRTVTGRAEGFITLQDIYAKKNTNKSAAAAK